jgi:hypothetical protein
MYPMVRVEIKLYIYSQKKGIKKVALFLINKIFI